MAEPNDSARSTGRWSAMLLGGRRLSAVLCLVSAYQAAVSEFEPRWVVATVLSAIIVAWGPPHWLRAEGVPQRLPWPSWADLGIFFLPAWLLMALTAAARLRGASPQLQIWVWGIGLLWLLVGAWLTARKQPTPRSDASSSAWLWLLLLVGVAAAVRIWRIDTVPRDVHIDEQFKTGMALLFYGDRGRDWFGADILMNLTYALSGAGTLIFGVNLVGGRAVSVLCGTAAVALLFDALRRVSTLRVALVGAALLATNHVAIAYSRLASEYIQPAFVVALIFAVAARLWTAPSYFNAVLLGIATALGAHTAPASLALLPISCGTLFVLLLLHPLHRRALLAPALIVTITCATAVAPFAIGMWEHWGSLMGRSQDLNIFSPRVMSNLKQNVYHTDSTLDVVVQQTWSGLTGFQNGRNAQPQYATTRPMADPYTAALLIPGVVFCLWHWGSFISLNALLFGAGNLVLGLGMNYSQGYQRATGALPAAATVMAIGLVECAQTLTAGRRSVVGWMRDLGLAAAVVVCGLLNLQLYFLDCRATMLVGDAGPEVGWAAREFVNDYHVHVVDWSKPEKELADLIIDGLPVEYNPHLDPLAYAKTAAVSGRDVFVLNGEDNPARAVLLGRFPGARVEVRRRDPNFGPAVVLIFVQSPQ